MQHRNAPAVPNITYVAPNRAHHYPYAGAMYRAGMLEAFISGFPRFSPRAPFSEIGSCLHRRDEVQLAYLAASRLGLHVATPMLGHWSKCYLDWCAMNSARGSTIFVAYNGCGLRTMRALRNTTTVRVLEVVNSHVENQDQILAEEHSLCGRAYRPIYAPERRRRLAEYDEADFILCPSEFVRNSFLERRFSPEKLLKNNYGFSLPGDPNRSRYDRRRGFRILYVGALSLRKGIRYLVEAFVRLQVSEKELHLVGPESKPTGLEGMSIPQGVFFHGPLKGQDLANAYSNCDVFVLPSVEEGLALVMAEAMGFGLPVIATQNTGASDLITNGEEGYIVPIRDPGSIAGHLQRLADDSVLRLKMTECAIKRARALGGWEESGANLIKTLRQIAAWDGK